MNFNATFFSHLNAKLSRHLLAITIIIGLIFDGWLLWQGSSLWPDLPLAPERISAKQLRVNEAQRVSLLQNLSQYQQISVTTAKSSAVFTVPSAR